MIRVVFTIIMPLLLPTGLYLLWVTSLGSGGQGDKVAWRSAPWLLLAGAGVLLLAIVLCIVTFGHGRFEDGVYIPPRYVNGHIVPGHMIPKAVR